MDSLFRLVVSRIPDSTQPVKLVDMGNEFDSPLLIEMGIDRYFSELTSADNRDTLTKSFRKLSWEAYTLMRETWLSAGYSSLELLRIDCHYCYRAQPLPNTAQNHERFESLLVDIRMYLFTPEQLQKCLKFPIIESNKLMTHFIGQLRSMYLARGQAYQ
jgi:hypothetical protein